MTIIAIRPWLVAAAADVDESEAVAISCVEFLLAEANAYYEERVLSRNAIRSVATHMRDSILDSIFAAVVAPDPLLPHEQFTAEPSPVAEARDRHVARGLPFKRLEKHRDPIAEKLAASPSRTLRSESSPDRAVGSNRRRHNMDRLLEERPSEHIPQVLTLSDEPEERPDIKMWRLKCLKEMTAASKRPTISKWGNVARAFKISDHKSDGSDDLDVIESQPPLLRQELLVTSSSAKTLKLKSSVDCFLNVLDLEPRDESDERTSVITTSRSNATRDISVEAPRNRKPIAISSAPGAKINRKKPVKQLNDKLSRRRTGANTAGASPWRFETSENVFTPERSDFNASALPSTIALASGVNLSQGESKIEGPEHAENGSAMSKKRFDLHQRLATDFLAYAAELELYGGRSPPPSSPGSPPFHTHLELYKHVEEVPAEPIPIPTLSRLSASALVIPHNHLSASLSTPSLRVRSSKVNYMPSPSGRLTALQDLDPDPARKARPSTSFKSASSTSIGFGATTNALHQQHNRRDGARSAEANKYLREFPKPKPGVIKVASSSRDDDRQRFAWGT